MSVYEFCERHIKSISPVLSDVLTIICTSGWVVSFGCLDISKAHCVSVNVWVCILLGLHGLAAGLQSHNVGSECPPEGLPGAGEQAAGVQQTAGSSDWRMGHQGCFTLSGLVPAGADCQRAPSPGKSHLTEILIYQDVIFLSHLHN